MLPQVPLPPEPFNCALQARHVPVHALSQQKPSTQFWLLWHSRSSLQTSPTDLSAWHWPVELQK